MADHLTKFERALVNYNSALKRELNEIKAAYARVVKAKSQAIAIDLRGDVYAEEVQELLALEEVK